MSAPTEGRPRVARLVELLARVLPPWARSVLMRVVQHRVGGTPWTVTRPVLGGRCLPGCEDPTIDWDGEHYCRVTIGRLALSPAGPRSTCGAAVEVTQGPDLDGVWQRRVWLLGLDADGHYADDGLVLDRATGRALGELVATAFTVAGYPDSPRQAERAVAEDVRRSPTRVPPNMSSGPAGGRLARPPAGLARLVARLARAGALTTRTGGPGEHLRRQAGPCGGDRDGDAVGPVGPVVAQRAGDEA